MKIWGSSLSLSACIQLPEWLIQFPSPSSLSIRIKSRVPKENSQSKKKNRSEKSRAPLAKTILPIPLFYFAQSPSVDSFHLSKKSNLPTHHRYYLYTISPPPLPPHLLLAKPCPLELPNNSLDMSPSLALFAITTPPAARPLESLWVFFSHIFRVYLTMTIFVVIGPKITAPIDFEVS